MLRTNYGRSPDMVPLAMLSAARASVTLWKGLGQCSAGRGCLKVTGCKGPVEIHQSTLLMSLQQGRIITIIQKLFALQPPATTHCLKWGMLLCSIITVIGLKAQWQWMGKRYEVKWEFQVSSHLKHLLINLNHLPKTGWNPNNILFGNVQDGPPLVIDGVNKNLSMAL